MKRLIIFLGLFTICFGSCDHDKTTDEKEIELRNDGSSGGEILSEAFLNFYNEEYIISGYGLQDHYSQDVEYILDKVYFSSKRGEVAINTSEYYGAPCWHCAVYKQGANNHYFLVPIVNTSRNTVDAVLFVPSENSEGNHSFIVDKLSLELNIFDEYDSIVNDFSNLFATKSWNFTAKEIQTRDRVKLPTIGCYEDCPEGFDYDHCGHPRDCDNTEIPGDNLSQTYVYIWFVVISSNPSDVPTILAEGGNGGPGNGGPSGIGEPDSEFYATLVGQLTEAIISLEDCATSLEDAKGILETLNDLFPQVNFNEDVDYTYSSMYGQIVGNFSPAELATQAAQGAVAMSVASAIANEDLATQLDVIDAINIFTCSGSSNGDSTDSSDDNEDELDCINAINEFAIKYGLSLSKKEKMLLKGVVPCSGDGFDEEIALCILNLDDYIIIEPSFQECEAYNCMLEHLRSNGNTHLCNMIGHLIDSDSHTIKFETGFVAGDGSTRISDLANKEITIKFHYSDCEISNVDQLAIAETLLHESQHANFYAGLIDLGLGEYTSAAVKEKWIEYVQANFNVAYADQHQAMVKEYMEIAANYLWELNGKTLTPDHYMKYVWDGLKHVWEGAYPQSITDSWEEKYKELNGIEPYLTNQNNFSCQ